MLPVLSGGCTLLESEQLTVPNHTWFVQRQKAPNVPDVRKVIRSTVASCIWTYEGSEFYPLHTRHAYYISVTAHDGLEELGINECGRHNTYTFLNFG